MLYTVAPLASVLPAHEQLGSPEKDFFVLGSEAEGTRSYGHGDLIFGRHVVEEVFPLVSAWLEQGT